MKSGLTNWRKESPASNPFWKARVKEKFSLNLRMNKLFTLLLEGRVYKFYGRLFF